MSTCVDTSAASSTNAWVFFFFADDFEPHEASAPVQVREHADPTELGRYKCNPLYDRGWSSRGEGVSVTPLLAEEYMVCPPLQTPQAQ
jgi:hypothetical protein